MSLVTKFVSRNLKEMTLIANGIRMLGMDAVLAAKSGHVGLPLGGAEMATLLYFAVMNHSSKNSKWADRDRFVLSAGHGSMLQYAALHLAGFNISIDDIRAFRQLNSKTPGHPEFGHTEGIECTTGPLGQGIAQAVGMALAERMKAARFNDNGDTVFDHRTFVLLGDGCMMEGVASEACSFAGQLKLNRLIALYDANNITIDGTIDISFSENVALRYQSYGWNVLHAHGNDFLSLADAMDKALTHAEQNNGTTGPTLIVCKTIAGKGSPKWEGKPKIHGNPMSADDVAEAKSHLGFPGAKPFEITQDIYAAAQTLVKDREAKFQQWETLQGQWMTKWTQSNDVRAGLWNQFFSPPKPVSGFLSNTLVDQFFNLTAATRTSGGLALQKLAEVYPQLVGGSADLAGSTLTTLPGEFVSASNFWGRNIHFGVREHAMAAICNGLALHGGFIPYCSTFAVFSDYMRPAIRLASLMNLPTIFILTHDSFYVGEDGPTHQPVEHLASLRMIPGLRVIRPGDALETLLAWNQSLISQGPTALFLTRQDLDARAKFEGEKLEVDELNHQFAQGAYVIQDFPSPESSQKLILAASGSELGLAFQVAKFLKNRSFLNPQNVRVSLNIRIVSCPSPQSLSQNPVLLHQLFPNHIPTMAIEAGVPFGWSDVIGRDGAVFGLNQFGASAPATKLAAHFGFTVEGISDFVQKFLCLRN